MQPASMQQRLQAIYDLDCGHRIEDFLLTDRGTAQALARRRRPGRLAGGPAGPPGRRGPGGVPVPGRASARPPHAAGPIRQAGHGPHQRPARADRRVSHFLYLIWNAGHARPVTQLEMELQAEVDKLVTWALLLDADPRRSDGDAIHDALFRRCHLRGELTDAQRARYRRASALAERYCRALMRRLSRPGSALLPELRRFYRMPHGRKIRLIQGLPN